MVIIFKEQESRTWNTSERKEDNPLYWLAARCFITELSRLSPRDHTRLRCSKTLADGDFF